ncbi:unnamed protein product [Caenorhabditis sp. 36 PRJEB53466]|nr:unnamed protein product [Caenorhabditis sp. 36 PRJEB53466]
MRDLILNLSWLMIIIAFFVFLSLKLGLTAGYGRYTNSDHWGLPASIAWFVQEAPSFFIPLYFMFLATSPCGAFLNLLFLAHYFNRAIVYPYRLRSNTTSPLYIMLSAVVFCAYNGFIQGAWNSLYQECDDSKFFYILGAQIFLIGMYINWRADAILRNLRAPGETGYKIPNGFLYDYITCPNYFGEIVEWIGYAIAARSLPAVAFAIFTIANIGPRAFSHHQWYKEKFPEYPKERKALIPLFL